MAPKSAADFLSKAKKLHTRKEKAPTFIKGYDNNDADDYDMSKLTREKSPP